MTLDEMDRALAVIMEMFPGATLATAEDLELLELARQEVEVWNRHAQGASE